MLSRYIHVHAKCHQARCIDSRVTMVTENRVIKAQKLSDDAENNTVFATVGSIDVKNIFCGFHKNFKNCVFNVFLIFKMFFVFYVFNFLNIFKNVFVLFLMSRFCSY